MTEDRDFKRLVRARMEKTGESYTTARAHLMAKSSGGFRVDDPDIHPTAAPTSEASNPPPLLPPEHEALAGMAEVTLVEATGHGWAYWVRLLDDQGARTLSHAAIARHLQEGEGVEAWWAQTITVGYERIRGLRAPGQQRDGSWQVGKSRTFPVSVERLFHAFHDEGERRRWLRVEGLTLRSARPGKVVRLVWPDGSVAEAGFTPKADSRSAVSVEHRKLPDGATATAMKSAWGEALDRLAGWLEEESADG